MDLNNIFLWPSSLLGQTIVILLDPSMHQSLVPEMEQCGGWLDDSHEEGDIPESCQRQVSDGGHRISGHSTRHLVLATARSLSNPR